MSLGLLSYRLHIHSIYIYIYTCRGCARVENAAHDARYYILPWRSSRRPPRETVLHDKEIFYSFANEGIEKEGKREPGEEN